MHFQKKLNESLNKYGDNIAIENGPEQLSYTALLNKANSITNFLAAKTLGDGTIVGVIMKDRLQIICAMIGVMNARCVFVPIDPDLPAHRLETIVKDMDLQHVISSGGGGSKINGLGRLPVTDYPLENILSAVASGRAVAVPDPDFDGDDSLYIYFTSGSTGVPKGILGRNASLLQFLQWEIREFGLGEGCRISQFISPYFDAFLRDVFVPLLTGGTICIPPADDDFYSTEKITTWIDASGINLIHCVPSVFRMINVESLTPRMFPDLKHILLSGEKINPVELINWYSIFHTRIQLVNLYGATESTMIRSFYRIRPEDARKPRIPIGSPIDDTQLLIAKKDFRPCQTLVPGDLYIISKYVTKGYLNAPELTRERFLTIKTAGSEETIAFKTGDKGRLLPDGTIELLGREDRQVKIRGIRVELDEIESILLSSGLVKNAAVTVQADAKDDLSLMAFIIPGEAAPDGATLKEKIFRHLEEYLPGHMMPSDIFAVSEFPLLSNGKINYKSLVPPVRSQKQLLAPVNPVEEKILSIWKEILGEKQIFVDDSFHQIGGNSLTIMSLIGKIHAAFDVRLSLSDLFRHTTIRKQAEFVQSSGQDKVAGIPKAALRGAYPLTSPQRRLYFLYEMEKTSTAYNMPQAIRLEGKPDTGKMNDAFSRLIARHSSLRVFIDVINGEPVQRVAERVDFEIQVSESAERDVVSRVKEFVRPFDLHIAPLIRAGLIRISETEHVLVVDVHHIVSDGISQNIMIRDFMALYNDRELPDLALDYPDFSVWLGEDRQQSMIAKQRDFWMNEFSGELQTLELPTDFTRPAVKNYEGNMIPFELSKEETDKLHVIAEKEEVTLFMLMLAMYGVLLAKLSSQRDIILCTPIAGRHHEGLDNIVGMFANTLPLRIRPDQRLRFGDFLQAVKSKTLACFDNQDYPYEELIDNLGLERDSSRNPLFDVMLAFENFKRSDLAMPELSIRPVDMDHVVSKFDLTLFGFEKEDRIVMNFEYATSLFKKETVIRLIGYFKKIVSSVTSGLNTLVGDLDIMPDEERIRILEGFNNTAVGFDRDLTIHSAFERMVPEKGYVPAVISRSGKLTYFELNERSNQLARMILRIKGREAGLIGIVMHRTEELIIAIMGILKSGNGYVPIDPEYPVERIAYIADNSRVSVVISATTLKDICDHLPGHIRVIDIADPALCREEKTNVGAAVPSSALSYLIYTSGSTGRPKGVMIEHRNVVNFVRGMTDRIPFVPGNRILCLASIAFDMSVPEVLLPLMTGLTVVLANAVEQTDINRLIRLIRSNQVDYLHVSPSHMKLILSHPEGSALMKEVKLLMLGAEPFPPELLPEIKDHYKGRIFNMYGPTETTVWSTIYECTSADKILIGSPIANTTIRILDDHQTLQPVGIAGELYIGGEGVARGYWENAELTEKRFVTDPFGDGGTIYRTGDLAKWSEDGNISFLGRIDNQVKIRGFRIELGEIESILVSYEPIQEAIVLAKGKDSDKYLVAYYIAVKEQKDSELREMLSRKLPAYMIPLYYVHLDRLPRTPNGKIDRKALPEPLISVKEGYMAPANETEERLRDIWAQVLKLDKGLVSMNSNFFELGGHSLKAILLVNEISREFQVDVPLKSIFENKDIFSMGRLLQSTKKGRSAIIPRAPEKPFYPLSYAQRDMYLMHELDDSRHFNMPMVVRLKGVLDREKLAGALDTMVKRHEILRTCFTTVDGMPVQRILDRPGTILEYFHVSEDQARQAIEAFVRPFDLKKAPLVRAGLFEIHLSEYYLVMDFHHIVIDGISNGILVKELTSLYLGEPLPDPALQYKDYAVWQQSVERQKELAKQKAFWLNEFADEIPVLELPRDQERSDLQDEAGGFTDFDISAEEMEKLRSVAEPAGVSMFMMVLAIYNILLAKISNQEDIIVGTLVAGRDHADVENMPGMFVTDLPLRNYPEGILSFREFLINVRAKALSCFENQAYPFKIPARESLNASSSNLYNAFLIFPNIQAEATAEVPDLVIETHDLGMAERRYDITLIAKENNKGMSLRLCCNKTFSSGAIKKFAAYFSQIVKGITANPEARIADISIITDDERSKILYEFNHTGKHIDINRSFFELFALQAAKTPDKTAVIHNGRSVGYAGLYAASGRLASLLDSRGVGAGKKVALYMPRGIAMLTGMLAVFRVRGAYVPVDVYYPKDRVREILADSEPAIVLTTEETMADMEDLLTVLPGSPDIINTDRVDEDGTFVEKNAGYDPQDLAYLIYTSGSTGKPKGVMIHQLGMVNHLMAKTGDLGLNGGDVIAQTASPCFDISVWQFLAALITGGTTCIIDNDTVLDPAELIRKLQRDAVTILELVPSLITAFIDGLPADGDQSLPRLRWMIPTGERLGSGVVNKWYSVYPDIRLVNAYGPTEASDDVTHHIVEKPDSGPFLVPIGRPVQNTHIYILDKYLNLCPIGVKGEICVAGLGVGKGYWKNKAITESAFIPNPLLPYLREKEYAIVYRTGDVGHYLENGNIVCLGRTDEQVKIRGFRLEPGEIEYVLLEHQNVKEAVVVYGGGEESEKRLIAFVVPSDPSLSIAGLRTFLKERLPDFMIPSAIIKIEKIPLTANGKIDKNALLKKDLMLSHAEEEYALPKTDVEKQLAEIWEDVLGIDMIGSNNTFFDLGGHSLLIIRCNQRIKNKFNVDLPFRLYFDHTLEQIAEEIDQLRADQRSPVKEPGVIGLSFLIALVCFFSMTLKAQKARVFPSNGRMVNVDSFNTQVKHMMDEIGIPGMSLAVIDDNRIVYFHTYGIRKRGSDKKVTKQTVFDGASLSKSYLAFVAYQLVDEGKLDLDKYMYQYLPDDQLSYDPRYKMITPRMVLSHSSGLENWMEENNPDTLEILYDPGTRFIYSGEGYQYLAKVIETILHQSYEQYITERVLKPLKLKNTYLKAKPGSGIFHKGSPSNYATGHEVFGNQRVFMNPVTIPAAGVHFTAEDYATLILAFFDRRHLTDDRVKDILTPIIRIYNSSVYYGPGFEVVREGNDTIIAHGGNKPGYKNQMFYSVTGKKGIVFMTNSDRGKSMMAKLSDLTVGLKITTFLESPWYDFDEYPSVSLHLLRTYDSSGREGMLAERKTLMAAGKMDFHSQIMLINHFRFGGQNEIAKALLQENTAMYPDSVLSYVMLGDLYLGMDSAEQAYNNYLKGRQLHFTAWSIEQDIQTCERMFAEADRRKKLLAHIGMNEGSIIRAEDYNGMRGVATEKTTDTGGGHDVGFIDSSDWMEYKVDVATGGTYWATFRVASLEGGGRLEFYSGDSLLTTVNIAATKGWQNWESLLAPIRLPGGNQTLRIYARMGGFNVNWVKFSRNAVVKNE